jgi:hypothetical protein
MAAGFNETFGCVPFLELRAADGGPYLTAEPDVNKG